MESTLAYLYRITTWNQFATLAEDPEYQLALSEWRESLSGGALDREDGAALREEAWGGIAFARGLGLGISLGLALGRLFPGEDEM